MKPQDIKEAIFNHFRTHFTPTILNRPRLISKGFQTLNVMQREMLEKPFSLGKVELALVDCDGNKSPGPDGFTMQFLQSKWKFLKEEFIKFLDDFHSNASIEAGINSSYLAFIPKKSNPSLIPNYRPITLIGCIYKLLLKVLAIRLKGVMPFVVGENQMA